MNVSLHRFHTVIVIAALLFAPFTVSANEGEDSRDRDPWKRFQVCFCHDAKTNPTTVCTNKRSEIRSHVSDVIHGRDSFRACQEQTDDEIPAVPEFGLITGIGSMIATGGSYIYFRKKQRV